MQEAQLNLSYTTITSPVTGVSSNAAVADGTYLSPQNSLLAAQQRLVDALRTYSRLAILQYNGGYTAYTTVLQADQSLFPAELTLASVRASMFVSSVNIYKAMGGGWVVAADAMTGDRAPPAAERGAGMPPLL